MFSFIREPRALISPVAGTTRDRFFLFLSPLFFLLFIKCGIYSCFFRAYGDLEWNGERMSLVDTGLFLKKRIKGKKRLFNSAEKQKRRKKRRE